MPRFQLLIREFGKAPRVVPLSQPAVVGRSRKADIVLEDEECGREQFRMSLVGATVVIEGIGKTNKTTVDGTVLGPGERATVSNGATIKVGRSSIFVQTGEATESAPVRPGPLDATLVARGPIAPPEPAAPPTPPPQDQTAGFGGPTNTLEMPRPGAAGDGGESFDQTINVKGFRPGQSGATTPSKPTPPTPPAPPPPAARTPAPPAPPANDDDFGQTINVKGFRPGQAGMPTPSPDVPPPAPAGSDEDFGQTINVKGFRPGQAGPQSGPQSGPTTPPPAPPPAPPPVAPRQATKPPAPTPPAPPAPPPLAPRVAPAKAEPRAPAADSVPPRSQPTTVYVDVGAMAPPAGGLAAAAADIESRLHQAMPRVFVKGAALKRRVRLMKTRNKVGRAETADVLLPNESVSELHAEIEFDGTTWILRDCGSTNGTFVDGTVLRGQSQVIGRNSLLGFGNLRGLFFVNDSTRFAADQRQEERALRLLVAAGRLTREVGAQVRTIAARDRNQSLAEVLLHETAIEPGDWANALAAARQHVTLMDRLRRLFRRSPPSPPPPAPTPAPAPPPSDQGR